MDSAISLNEDATIDEVRSAAWRAREAKEEELGQSIFIPYAEVVERAERIYDERYRAKFELLHHGRFVVVDIESEQAYLGDTPDEAWLKGLRASLTATLFLFKVGFEAAYDFTSGGRDAGREWFT